MLSLTFRYACNNLIIQNKKLSPILSICNNVINYKQPIKHRFCSTNNVKQEFTPLYNLRYIGVISAVSRLKTYQGAFTAISFPTCIILETVNIVGAGTAITTLVFGLFGSAILTFYSWRMKNIIGIIYVSKELDTLKLSYVDFWGKRIDKLLPVSEWVPLSEIERTPLSKFYLKAACYDAEETWKFFHKSGHIFDQNLFEKVLGTV